MTNTLQSWALCCCSGPKICRSTHTASLWYCVVFSAEGSKVVPKINDKHIYVVIGRESLYLWSICLHLLEALHAVIALKHAPFKWRLGAYFLPRSQEVKKLLCPIGHKWAQFLSWNFVSIKQSSLNVFTVVTIWSVVTIVATNRWDQFL